jgi:Pro-Pro endopeptidase
MVQRKQFLLFLILLSFMIMGNSQAEKEGIKLLHFPSNAPLKNTMHLTSEAELNHIIVLPKVSFDEKEAGEIISRIDTLPTSLLKKVHNHDIIVKLFTGKLTDNSTARHLSGKVPRGYEQNTMWDDIPGVGGGKTVLIKIGASAMGNGHGSVNLELHELAHSIDRHVFQEIRNEAFFLSIWNQEKEQLFPDNQYLLTYPEEYLAEAFAFYYIGGFYRNELRTNAPLTYQFIKNLK